MYLGGICFITDSTFADISLIEATTSVLKAGITCIQYREKGKTRRDICEEASTMKSLVRSARAILIVNDYPDIALAVDADGVHLGQNDLPIQEARRIMGNKIVGISTHTLAQAQEAEACGADYIGFGPIFRTTTKDAGEPVGLDSLRIIKRSVHIPVVAIGGIKLENISSVLEAGSDAVAVASAFYTGNVQGDAEKFLRFIRSYSSNWKEKPREK